MIVMSGRAFFDSNLFLYAFSRNPVDLEKKQIVSRLLEAPHRIHISTQILQEFIACALKKRHLDLGEKDIDDFLYLANTLMIVPLHLDLIGVQAGGQCDG